MRIFIAIFLLCFSALASYGQVKSTWLSNKGQNGMLTLGCFYDGSQLVAGREFVNGTLQADSSRWVCRTSRTSVKGQPGAFDLSLTFKIVEGEAKSSGVAVVFNRVDWSTDNYVLAPAAVYNGNRFHILPIGYPPYIDDPALRTSNMPITTTNIPHLNWDRTPSKIEMLTSNTATPMMGFFDPHKKRGWIILTMPDTRLGTSGMFIEEDPTSKRASFVISAPGVREQRYVMCGHADSGDVGADLKAGDEVSLRLRVYDFQAADVPAFLGKVFDVRKALTGPSHYRNFVPFSYIADTILKHHDAYKWFEGKKFSYICNGPYSGSPYNNIQAGWGGLPVYSQPQVDMETPERLRRVSKTFDALTQMSSKSGLIYAMFMDGELFGDHFGQITQRRSISMVRRSGETLYSMISQIELMKLRGHLDMIKPEWDVLLRGIADGLVKLWKDNGEFGQFVDVETGKLDIWGSSAGVVNISALALASEYFKNPEYLKIAEAAGKYYYKRDLCQGYTTGGPAEILQAPDSESAYDLVEAYVVLYEMTGKREWLKRAQDAAYLLSTWMVSYEFKFPAASDMGRVHANSIGSVFASCQNAHSAPGMYVVSGDFLLKLYRATGNKRYADMYKDTVHNMVQYVNTPTNPVIPSGAIGAVSERVNTSDWEGKGNIGMVSPGDSNMAWETLAALTCLHNPGIYVRTDTAELLVLDHIEAQIIDRDKQGITLKLTNSTPYSANVSIFAESTKEAKKPLGWNAFIKWPKVEIQPGQSIEIRIGVDHSVKGIG